MKIKIISGTYGWKPDEDSSVESVSKGGTCEVSDAEAARLVGLGVAAYADVPVQAPNTPPEPPPGGEEPPAPPQEEPPVSGGEGDPDAAEVARLERMQRPDLEQMATDLGVDSAAIFGAKNKHDLAVLIVAAGEPDGGEAPPDLGAGDIVQ